jgi:hypothetical protein
MGGDGWCTVAGEHRYRAKRDLHHHNSNSEKCWAVNGPGRSYSSCQQCSDDYQDRDYRRYIPVCLLHQGVILINRADASLAQWPVGAPHTRVADSDLATEDDQEVDRYRTAYCEPWKPPAFPTR